MNGIAVSIADRAGQAAGGGAKAATARAATPRAT
jgi:hypothetical protein